MVHNTLEPADRASRRGARSGAVRRAAGRGWRTATTTLAACARHRVTGLAGEAAFFAVLSAPPLLLGLVGTLGYLVPVIGAGTVASVQAAILRSASFVLAPQAVDGIVGPTLHEVLATGQAGVLSIGFVLAVWSGSSALNVYIDTITLVHGLNGRRGVVRQRLLSVALYLAGLLVGVVLLPLLVTGPQVITDLFPPAGTAIRALYWPTVVLLSALALTSLYQVSVPEPSRWRQHLPGALLAVVLWLAGSAALRGYLGLTIERSPIYGSLSAPIAVLLWLYVTALAVLLGATLNAQLARDRARAVE